MRRERYDKNQDRSNVKPALATLVGSGSDHTVHADENNFVLTKSEFDRLVGLYEQRRRMNPEIEILTQTDLREITNNRDLIEACPYGIKIESYTHPQRERTTGFNI